LNGSDVAEAIPSGIASAFSTVMIGVRFCLLTSRRQRLTIVVACLLAGAVLLMRGTGFARAAGSPGPPIVEATWVTDVTSTSANLRAEINPNGLSSTYRFEYVTQVAWEASGWAAASVAPPSGAGALGAGTESIVVVQHIASLSPTTAYRYRVRASNGTVVFGLERTLTTEVPSNVFELPDNRAWELVSPPDKEGGAIAAPESLFGGGAFQAAAGGGAIAYSSPFSFAGGQGALGASQYLAVRSGSGWSTQNITTPMLSGSYGDEPDGVPYRIFSTDLSKALLSNGVRCRSIGTRCPVANPPLPGSGAPPGYRNYYLRDGDAFQALLTAADVAGLALGSSEFEVSLAGATPGLDRLILSSCAKLTANATEAPAPGGCDEDRQNLYEWGGGEMALLNLLPGDSAGTPGAELAAQSGALSSDGSRVYFTVSADDGLYLRDGSETKQVDDAQGGGGSFQTASAAGSTAFFTDEASPGDAHLYRYLAATDTATDLTPAGGVKGVLGASADGSYAYYQDASGLQQWHEGTTTQLAAGADATLPAGYPPATGASRISADGRSLAFLSDAEPTGYDNTDANTGLRDTELYLYREPLGGGAGALLCASCNPTGERPTGPASIPGAYANGTAQLYQPRVLSADGSRLFFDSADRLAIADTDSLPDVYQWEAQGDGDCTRSPGCVSLISEARSEGASFLDASASGDDVFFLTAESSVGADPGSIDVYDARVGGGLPEPPKPFVCLGDACQALPSPPDDPTPGTLVPNSGNPPLQITKHKPRKHKPRKRHHHRGSRR
jgi:hypothetical protein